MIVYPCTPVFLLCSVKYLWSAKVSVFSLFSVPAVANMMVVSRSAMIPDTALAAVMQAWVPRLPACRDANTWETCTQKMNVLWADSWSLRGKTSRCRCLFTGSCLLIYSTNRAKNIILALKFYSFLIVFLLLNINFSLKGKGSFHQHHLVGLLFIVRIVLPECNRIMLHYILCQIE